MALTGCAATTNARLAREQADKFNKWVGIQKEERIRTVGIPTGCYTLSDGGEACEWRTTGAWGNGSGGTYTSRAWEDRAVFTYGPDHLAKSWSYVGRFGNFTSSEYPSVKKQQQETSGP